MPDHLFRFNNQLAAIACGDRGLKIRVDVNEHPVESVLVPWQRTAEFSRWCRGRVVDTVRPEFSRRLDEACGIRKHTGIPGKLAHHLGVSYVRIHHWRKGHSLPSKEYARQIAAYFGWDEREALLDLRDERMQRAAKKRGEDEV